jgi:hypothetical protein
VQELDELIVGVGDGGDDGVLNRRRGEQLTRDVAGEPAEPGGDRRAEAACCSGMSVLICASTSTFW